MSDRIAALTLVVAEVIRETDDACTLVFDGPALPYRAGQFLTLRVPSDLTPTARCYSLSSAPSVDERMAITVKRIPGGYGSGWVHDCLRAGSELQVLPPAGRFTPRDLSADLLLCAAGSGITPVMSIVKAALAQPGGRVSLVYANRDERSVIFAEELRGLAARFPERLTVLHWLESVQGLPSRAALASMLRPLAGPEVFICGPGPFMDAATGALADLGVQRSRIHLETFVSIEGDPWAVQAAVPASEGEPVPAAAGPAGKLWVEFDGREHALDWPADRLLLDAVLDAGIAAPYSCRSGNCGACACRLLEGEVTMRENSVLEAEDLADGWVLACQSVATSSAVRVSYD